jgi:hypothetical protein
MTENLIHCSVSHQASASMRATAARAAASRAFVSSRSAAVSLTTPSHLVNAGRLSPCRTSVTGRPRSRQQRRQVRLRGLRSRRRATSCLRCRDLGRPVLGSFLRFSSHELGPYAARAIRAAGGAVVVRYLGASRESDSGFGPDHAGTPPQRAAGTDGDAPARAVPGSGRGRERAQAVGDTAPLRCRGAAAAVSPREARDPTRRGVGERAPVGGTVPADRGPRGAESR